MTAVAILESVANELLTDKRQQAPDLRKYYDGDYSRFGLIECAYVCI